VIARLRAVSALLGLACLFLAVVLLIVVLGTHSSERLPACLVVAGLGVVLLGAGLSGRSGTSAGLLLGALDLVGRVLLGLAPVVALAYGEGAPDHQLAGGAVVLVGIGAVGLLACLPAWRRRRAGS
jgi:hypothetical protein